MRSCVIENIWLFISLAIQNEAGFILPDGKINRDDVHRGHDVLHDDPYHGHDGGDEHSRNSYSELQLQP